MVASENEMRKYQLHSVQPIHLYIMESGCAGQVAQMIFKYSTSEESCNSHKEPGLLNTTSGLQTLIMLMVDWSERPLN